MTDPSSDPNAAAPPAPQVQRPRRGSFSLIWLVPLVAALAGLGLAVRSYMNAGPSIDITFETAEGVEAQKTEVRYKDVVIGKVRSIDLNSDRSHVIVRVDLVKSAAGIAVDDTRFWIERPRIGLGGISGINTLLSGAYISVDIGVSEEKRNHFTGLEKPPAVTHDQKGRSFILRTADAGSLNIGSPVYYRRIPVGRIVSSDLDPDGKNITLQIFINTPYDRFVDANTRFWNASGVDLSLNAAGLKLNTQSLATVFAGGVAFQPMQGKVAGQPAKENTVFTLYSDQATGLAPPDGPATSIRMVFRRSTRGLDVGSPIDFRGITLGTVSAIQIDYDVNSGSFLTNVDAQIYPERLGPAYRTLQATRKSFGLESSEMTALLISRGLRAQLRTGNLLTGQLYVALEMFPKAKTVKPDADADPVVIPTAPGDFEEVQMQIQNIIRKLSAVPYDEIGKNLNATLENAQSLLKQLDQELAPEARKVLKSAQHTLQSLDDNVASPDAPLQQNAGRTLQQVDAAARSLRTLADYLERHPESLLRGKPEADEPAADAAQGSTP